MIPSRPILRALIVLLAASLACALPGGQARESTPTSPPAAAPTPTPTDAYPELSPPPPAGLVDALQAQVDAGQLTQEQALVTGLQLLTGEADLQATLDETPADLEGTGLAFDAQRYLQVGTDESVKAELQRLLTILAPPPEVLLPFSTREGASFHAGARLAEPAAQADCAELYASGFPPGSSAQCFLYKETPHGSSTIQVFYPTSDQPPGFTTAYADAALQAVIDSLDTYASLEIPGRSVVLKDIEVVFSLLDTDSGTTMAVVPSDPGQNPCTVVLFPLAMAVNDEYQSTVHPGPGEAPQATAIFQQTVAHEVFHCFQIWNFPAMAQNALWGVQDWWGESTATYFSNVVYPSVNFEWIWIDDWSYNSALSPLVYSSYDNFGFFQYLADRIGNGGVLALIESLEPAAQGDEAAQQARLAQFPDIEQLFEDYAVAFMDGTIADSSGQPIPTTPAFVPPMFRLEVAEDGLVPFGGSPFTLTRYGLTIGSAQSYSLDPMVGAFPGLAVLRPVNQAGPWTKLPAQVEGSCASRRYYLLLANAGQADSFTFGLTVSGDGALDCGFTPTPPPPVTAGTPGVSPTGCPEVFQRFGFLEAGSSYGYGCQDNFFRAWYDNDFDSYEFITAAAGESYGGVRIEVDARIVSAVPYGGAIVVCRGNQAFGDFYSFTLSPDGSLDISDYLGGEEQIARAASLPEGTMKPEWNHIRVDCIGDHLAFYVNGVLGLERSIDTLDQGDVGLGAGGSSEGFTEVLFDNLVITTP